MATHFSQALGSFKFPKEIKNDIIYCQRAMRSYIMVHQMIVEQYSKDKEFSEVKHLCLDEIENDIREINCEQQYLLLRVRRIIDEFFKSLYRGDVIGVDRLQMNEYLSRQLVPFIQDKEYICIPSEVRFRPTEAELIQTYLLSDNWRNLRKSPTPPSVPVDSKQESPEPIAAYNSKQVSLLKPMSERVVVVAPVKSKVSPTELIIPDGEKTVMEPVIEPTLSTSSKVKLSRLNLRQALNKAAAAIHVNVPLPPPTPVAMIAAPKPSKYIAETARKTFQKAVKSDSSSSEESLDVRVPSPPELVMKTKPYDYDQSSFLRMFNLYTQDQIQLMQQRRSKRKRRGAHNNERADFHYGRIGHILSSAIPTKKRKKEFLLSPRVNRAMKKKRSSDFDRSNSSSPDEKIICNECMKRNGVLIQCKECSGSYHEDCHRDMNIKTVRGQCPSCSRIQYNTMLQQEAEKKIDSVTLRGQCRELELKLALENHRRKKLQQESKMYKIDMRKLFNIVEKIKTDENDS